jgi:hypothetical protein
LIKSRKSQKSINRVFKSRLFMKPALLFLLFWGTCFTAFAQRVTINGKITDQSGRPVPFASIYVKNTTSGASANVEGDYSLHLQPEQYDL